MEPFSTLHLPRLGHTRHEISYSCSSFPRYCAYLNKCSLHLKYLYRNPKVVVFCEKYHYVDTKLFEVENVGVEVQTVFNRLFTKPIRVVVCILECGVNGSLTKLDTGILEEYRSTDNSQKALFFIEGNLTRQQFCNVSEEISMKLKLNGSCNDVLHRLFSKTDDIAVRISMLLEAQLIEMCKEELPKEKVQNEKDLLYHQLKYVSIRNDLICEFGHRGDTLFVSIRDMSAQKHVQEYLHEYIPKENEVEVQLYKEMVVENLCLMSGDRVASGIGRQATGTVGFILKDDYSYVYCATCKHVIENCVRSAYNLNSDDISCTDITIKRNPYFAFKTDRILIPSKELDFSIARLKQKDVPVASGLRDQKDNFVNGKVFGRDMLRLPNNTKVYKWGDASGLTVGIYVGRTERINQPPFFTIQSEGSSTFAKGGDSGSLVCYSMGNSEIAAIMLKGRLQDHNNLFVGFKLVDALTSSNAVIPSLKECICTQSNQNCSIS